MHDDDSELKKFSRACLNTVGANHSVAYRVANYYNSWVHMARHFAWLTRFASFMWINHCNRLDKTTNLSIQTGKLSSNEITQAERALICHAQTRFQAEKYQLLKNGQVNKNSPLRKLNPTVKEGLIYALGRTQLPLCVLSADSPVTKAIVRSYHEKAHVSVEWCLSDIREHSGLLRVDPLSRK